MAGSGAVPFVPRYDLPMANGLKRIGLISDTHGLLRKEAVEALRGSELIIHAGDVGKPEILEELRKIAPVLAVRGNVDTEPWAKELPATAVAEAGAAVIYVLHDVKALDLNPAASELGTNALPRGIRESRRNPVTTTTGGATSHTHGRHSRSTNFAGATFRDF